MPSSSHPSGQTTDPASTGASAPDATPAANGPAVALRTGRCQCGHIVFQVEGIPDDPHLCSCQHETRISGAPLSCGSASVRTG